MLEEPSRPGYVACMKLSITRMTEGACQEFPLLLPLFRAH